MKDFIFVHILEIETSPKLNLVTCNLKGVCFYKVSNSANSDIPIVKELPDVFEKILLGVPPC